jgi:hypothetical protein
MSILIALASSSGISSNSYTFLDTLLFVGIFLFYMILALPGPGTKISMMFLSRGVEAQLAQIENYLKDSKKKMHDVLSSKGVQKPEEVIDRISEIFTIDPVSVEPTDIIGRMRLMMRTTEDKIRDIMELAVPNIDPVTRSKLEVSAEVVNSLNMIHKVIRHYLISAKKTNSVFILYQLQMVVPQLVKISEAYSKAMSTFMKGIPVGDSLGPLVAANLLMNSQNKWNPSRDTIAGEVEFEGRKLIVVKAEGPMATVGRPGEAVANVVEEYKGNIKRIITVDAALKLEGEETGSVAEGTGVAMGDPGPEKIAIERIAVKYGIPIDALIVKMGMEEAITEMRKSVYDASSRIMQMLKRIIQERTHPGDIVVVVGVGNTSGVAQ